MYFSGSHGKNPSGRLPILLTEACLNYKYHQLQVFNQFFFSFLPFCSSPFASINKKVDFRETYVLKKNNTKESKKKNIEFNFHYGEK